MAFKRYNPQTLQWEYISIGPTGPQGATGPLGPSGYSGSIGSLSYTSQIDTFTGNGVQTSFTLSTVPRDIKNTTVNINGVIQQKNTYALSGAVLTFSETPPANSAIEVTTQLFGPSYTPFNTRRYTGNGSATTYTVSSGVTADSTIVSLNGVIQVPTNDYSVSSTTLTFAVAPSANASIVIRELPGALQGDIGYTGSQGILGYLGSTGYTGSASTTPGYSGSQGVPGGVYYSVTNNGTATFTINGATNPTLTLARGYTYYFTVNSPGYNFYIKTTNIIDVLNLYNTGVTNNGIDSGTITFTVPLDAPSNLYYISTTGTNMSGNIVVLDAGFGYTGSLGYTGSSAPGYTGSTGGVSTGKAIAMSIVFGG